MTLAQIAEDHRRLLQAAGRLGLDIRDRAHHEVIVRDTGWDGPLAVRTYPAGVYTVVMHVGSGTCIWNAVWLGEPGPAITLEGEVKNVPLGAWWIVEDVLDRAAGHLGSWTQTGVCLAIYADEAVA